MPFSFLVHAVICKFDRLIDWWMDLIGCTRRGERLPRDSAAVHRLRLPLRRCVTLHTFTGIYETSLHSITVGSKFCSPSVHKDCSPYNNKLLTETSNFRCMDCRRCVLCRKSKVFSGHVSSLFFSLFQDLVVGSIVLLIFFVVEWGKCSCGMDIGIEEAWSRGALRGGVGPTMLCKSVSDSFTCWKPFWRKEIWHLSRWPVVHLRRVRSSFRSSLLVKWSLLWRRWIISVESKGILCTCY